MDDSVTVITLLAPDTGVLCWIAFVLNAGTTTMSGAKPPLIPYLSPVALVIAALAIDPMLLLPSVSAASTLTAGDVRSDVGFVKVNVIAQGVFAGTVVATVRISVPVLFQLPVVPNEPLAHVVVTAKLDDEAVSDPASPVIVTVAFEPAGPPVMRS